MTKSENTWYIDIKDVDEDTYDLSVVNPKMENLSEDGILKEIQRERIDF